MFLPPGADNPSYVVASAQQCKYCSFSLLYREQERALQTSSGRVRWRAWVSHTQRVGAGWRSRPPFALHVCVLTGAPRRRRPGRCPLFCTPILSCHRPIVLRRLTGAGGDYPARRPGGPSAIALPLSRSLCRLLPRPFCDVSGAPHPLCRSIDRVPTSARNSVADRLVIAPPFASLPAIQL